MVAAATAASEKVAQTGPAGWGDDTQHTAHVALIMSYCGVRAWLALDANCRACFVCCAW